MPAPQAHNGVRYTDFIKQICTKRGAKTYLEIGVENGLNLAAIEVDHAVGIDPDFNLKVDVTRNKNNVNLFRTTSDSFFYEQSSYFEGSVDVAFLDGMHVFEFLLRDFYNTEAICSPHGLILIHDCLPFGAEMITRQSQGGAWTGDIWKIIPILKKLRSDLEIVLIDCEPTGLVAVGNLDPSNTILRREYMRIVKEFSAMPNDWSAVEAFYDTVSIVKAKDILHEFDHTLFFPL